MKIRFIAIAGLSALLTACGSGEKEDAKKEKNKKDTQKKEVQDCYYEYNPTQTSMEWEAFKYVKPAGVKGTFDNVIITGTERTNSIQSVFENAKFTIPIATINSNNPDRDGKLKKFFFGVLTQTDTIKGKLLSWEGQKGSIEVTMNEKTNEVPVDITVKGDSIKLAGTIHMEKFDGLDAIASLNEACKDLHTGPDGKESKLWPNIDFRLATKLKKDCQ